MSARKRKSTGDAAPAAAASAPSSRARSRSVGINYTDNGAAAGGAFLPEASLPGVANRKFWEQFDTPLLWAWLDDYEDELRKAKIVMDDALKADREKLTQILVQSEWVQRPQKDVALAELQKCWRRRAKPRKGAPPPGFFQPPAASSSAASSAGPKPPASRTRSISPIPLSIEEDEDDDEEEDDSSLRRQILQQLAMQSKKHTASSSSSSSQAAQGYIACTHCKFKNVGETNHDFNCTNCGLISSEDRGSEMNQLMIAKMKGPAARTGSSSSVSSAAGQSTTDTYEGSSATVRRERELKLFTRVPPHPSFAAPAAGAAFPHTAALSINQQAYNATAYEPPSELLMQCIRQGQLLRLAFAKPRLISDGFGKEKSKLSVAADGTVTTEDASSTPTLGSFEEFTMAMVSTILPSLIDRPQALSEYLALSRTITEIYTAHRSWAIARDYLEQVLTHCTFQRKSLAPVVAEVLTNTVITKQLGQQQAGGARGPSSSSSSSAAASPARGQFCQNHNFHPPCTRVNCNYIHECQYGSRGCKDTKAHMSKDCPLRPPPREGAGLSDNPGAQVSKSGGRDVKRKRGGN